MWEGLSVNEGFKEAEKKQGLNFSLQQDSFILLPPVSSTYQLTAPCVLHSERIDEIGLHLNIFGAQDQNKPNKLGLYLVVKY